MLVGYNIQRAFILKMNHTNGAMAFKLSCLLALSQFSINSF
jgi:hypothetical protein